MVNTTAIANNKDDNASQEEKKGIDLSLYKGDYLEWVKQDINELTGTSIM